MYCNLLYIYKCCNMYRKIIWVYIYISSVIRITVLVNLAVYIICCFGGAVWNLKVHLTLVESHYSIAPNLQAPEAALHWGHAAAMVSWVWKKHWKCPDDISWHGRMKTKYNSQGKADCCQWTLRTWDVRCPWFNANLRDVLPVYILNGSRLLSILSLPLEPSWAGRSVWARDRTWNDGKRNPIFIAVAWWSELLAVSFWWTFQTSQETTPVSMGFTSATLHPLLSIGAFLFFLVGGVLIGRDKAGWDHHSHVRESSHMIQFSSNALGQVTFAGCLGALGVSQIATHREGSCSFSFLPTGQLNQHVSCRV